MPTLEQWFAANPQLGSFLSGALVGAVVVTALARVRPLVGALLATIAAVMVFVLFQQGVLGLENALLRALNWITAEGFFATGALFGAMVGASLAKSGQVRGTGHD